jgi:NadR type nicotinamide-nucleotide adenylyltransferase
MKKIVIIGPESTGKSTLSRQLASYYQTIAVPEYAREYLETHGMNYTYNDLLTIAKGQIAQEDRLIPLAKNNLLIIDTNMYVMKVWCEFVFGKCHQWILDQLDNRSYDLYLLMNTDIPWVKDNLREYPDLETREKLYNIYKELLIHSGTPWVNISGKDDERMQKAITAIEALKG